MCGRAACSIDPDAIVKACRYKDKRGQWKKPEWRDAPNGQKFVPSYNITPGSQLPVMLSGRHMTSEGTMPKKSPCNSSPGEPCERLVVPMRWGLIPSYHLGAGKVVLRDLINARSDGMLHKPTFKAPLNKGRRCVILLEGYYEWQHKDHIKQPYYIHCKERETTDVGNDEPEMEEDTKVRRPLMTLAGIFDIWKPKNGDAAVYSLSIITVDAHKHVDFIHHRMPAVLHGEEEVGSWLNFAEVPLEKAVELIRPICDVDFHPVSTLMNKPARQGPECVKPIDLSKPKANPSSNLMAAWLGKSAKKPAKQPSSPLEKNKDDAKEPSGKKSNMMAAWLGKSAVKPIKRPSLSLEGDEDIEEPAAKRCRSQEVQ